MVRFHVCACPTYIVLYLSFIAPSAFIFVDKFVRFVWREKNASFVVVQIIFESLGKVSLPAQPFREYSISNLDHYSRIYQWSASSASSFSCLYSWDVIATSARRTIRVPIALTGRDSASTVLVRIICVRTPGRVVLAMKLAVLVRTRLALAYCSTIEQRA
jgi:hypothetical protein